MRKHISLHSRIIVSTSLCRIYDQYVSFQPDILFVNDACSIITFLKNVEIDILCCRAVCHRICNLKASVTESLN